MKPILVLLPGLDGSGMLFAPLTDALGGDFDCRVLPLPCGGDQTQSSLAQRLFPQLPTQRFVLLGESFSGAIAAELVAMQPANLMGLILVASFLQSPRPFLLKVPKPIVWLGWHLRRPLAALWWPFCGYRKDVSTRRLVLQSLQQLHWQTLWQRLRAIRTMTNVCAAITCPALKIRARADCLVPESVSAHLSQGAPVHAINGPHFLLQSEPHAAADVIRNWLQITFPETG